MSAFEYVSVMASIIIGLALVDVLVSANRLIRAGNAVKWDWAAPAAAVLVVMTLLQIWWSQYRPTAETMTIGQFLPLFVELILLFLLAAAALPDDVPAEGLDLRAYYARNSRYFWGLYMAALGWIVIVEVASLSLARGDVLGFLQARIPEILVVALFGSLTVIKARWWHLLCLIVFSIGPVGWLSRSLGSA